MLHRRTRAVALALTVTLLLVSCTSDDTNGASSGRSSTTGVEDDHSAASCVDTTVSADDPQAGEIVDTAEQVMADQNLQTVLLRVERGDEEVVTAALGETLPGVPATPDMHFWNGAAVFSYLGTAMLQLQEEGLLDIDEPIEEYRPDVPEAERITPRMLMSSTSGYADYVPMDAWIDALYADPFRAFTQTELEEYAFGEPLLFEPGTNVSYSHLNFRLAGIVIEEAAGQPLAEVLAERILRPLEMDSTTSLDTADIPPPVLHTFTDERGVYEETSGWSPAWGVPEGAAQVTTVCDLAVAASGVGSGELISEESYETLVEPGTVGLGERTDECPSCIPMTEELHLGLGVVVAGDWVVQTPQFTGIAGIQAHLPSEDLSIAVASTIARDGDVDVNGSTDIFEALVPVLAPDSPVPDL